MKKVLFIAVVALLGLGKASAQETSYGVTAGYQSTSFNVSFEDESASTSFSGYFLGFFAEFSLSEKVSLQPELHYSSVSMSEEDEGSIDEIIIPIMAKYYVSEKFNIQAGPQFDFVTGDSQGMKALGFGLAFGVGLDFSENFFVTTRYSLGLSNRLEDDSSDFTGKFNTFQIGLGYRF